MANSSYLDRMNRAIVFLIGGVSAMALGSCWLLITHQLGAPRLLWALGLVVWVPGFVVWLLALAMWVKAAREPRG